MSNLLKALKKVVAITLPKGFTKTIPQEDLKDAYNYASGNLIEAFPYLPEFWEEDENSPKNITLVLDKIILQDPKQLIDISAFTNKKPGWLLTLPTKKWVSELKQEYEREFEHLLAIRRDHMLPPAITIENEFGDGRGRCLLQYALNEKIPVANFKLKKFKG